MANSSILAAFERMWLHVVALVGSKSDANHDHNDIYYTEAEIESKLDNKADSVHNHDNSYEAKGTVESGINLHNTSTDTHNDIRVLVGDVSTKLNNFLNIDDTTKDQLSEIIALIEENADDIESITSGKVNVSDIINNLTTNVDNKPLSAAQGVAIKALIDALQEDLNTDVGNLSTHTGNTTVHITANERINWNDAYAKRHEHDNKSVLDNTTASYTITEQAKLSGIQEGAEVNQNAFSNVKVGSTTVAADNKTDTIEFVGENITITPDATNDKITFKVEKGTTDTFGIVKLTDSVNSEDITTAATPKNVKAAYDLANTAKTNAATAQATADSKANSVHTHTVSDITDALDVLATIDFVNEQISSTLKSNYDLWLSLGNTGTPADFLEWLKGDSAYELWVKQDGNAGKTEEEFLASLDAVSSEELSQVLVESKAYVDEKLTNVNTEEWTFILEDGSSVTKKVVLG